MNKNKTTKNKQNIVIQDIDETIINNLKCPICSKICSININKEELLISFKCNNNCSYQNLFQKELNCSKNFLKKNKSYLSDSDIFCLRHPKLNYHSYCFNCKMNICIQCLKEHTHHKIVDLNNLKPKNNEVFSQKIKIKEKFKKFNKIMNEIIKWKKQFIDSIDSFINIMNNIYIVEKFIIMNFDIKNSHNYNYIENYNHIKRINFQNPELDEFIQTNDWTEKGIILMKAITNIQNKVSENKNNNYNNRKNYIDNFNKNQIIMNINEKNHINNNKSFYPKYLNYPRKVQKMINSGNNINKNDNYISTVELNENMDKKGNNKNSDTIIRMDNNNENSNINNELNYENNIINNDLDNNIINNNYDNLNLKNIDINTTRNIRSNQSNNDISNKVIFNNENQNRLTENDELNNNNYLLKYENTENDIIKSIEFTNNNKLLISTSKAINIYKINSTLSLDLELSIEDFNKINYVTQLSDGNIIICLFNEIIIIKIIEDKNSKRYLIKQELKSKYNSLNINKVIEIKIKNYIISCDKNNIVIYEKYKNSYYEKDNIKTSEEIKCIHNLNEICFCAVKPESQCIVLYDIEDYKDNNLILKNLEIPYGRYNVTNNEKYIFIGGNNSIYLVSLDNYEIVLFNKIDEKITCIDYDSRNNCIICGSYKEENNDKSYNLIIFLMEIENINDNNLSNINDNNSNNINIIEKKRIENSHQNYITVIKSSKDGYILTGSNDKVIRVWY